MATWFAMFLRNWQTVNRKIDKIVTDQEIFAKIANDLVVHHSANRGNDGLHEALYTLACARISMQSGQGDEVPESLRHAWSNYGTLSTHLVMLRARFKTRVTRREPNLKYQDILEVVDNPMAATSKSNSFNQDFN